ncbi:MAG TPA: site-2 protease family protein [Candidatus Saccharimonadales bacterium]|nr:site-2 protease family protein [Candidatus Saccharimonadales bacterium]
MFGGLTTSQLLIYAVSLIIGLTMHEAMHAFAARWLGDTSAEDSGRLTLNPLRHIDPYTTILMPIISLLVLHVPFLAARPVPFNPHRLRYREYGVALVGLAGPLTNLVLAAIAGILIRLIMPDINGLIFECLYIFAIANTAIFVFNMIPFPPLDGSRALYAVAPDALRTLMERIEAMGVVSIIIVMMLFFFTPVGTFCEQVISYILQVIV